jgi:5-methyltetrahydrofolate--homocysteine methyltransferase
VAVFQIVTVGNEATERTERLQAAGSMRRAFLPRLSVQTARAGRVRPRPHPRELGMAVDQGKRYSWGYPSCPDLSQHRLVDDLLDLSTIGVRITDGFQFEPEQTTAALVVTPRARVTTRSLSRR